ncbi:MAG TPA: class I SAM-dependent methyltransferase [Bryobacteraceae bacterium]|nr:class I SAM-dependent methyltransferase [Bryobacteraceae bacterium]HPT26527.1 class I SAM-dependent methyltransferase [Bryobacteraceae bacterium]
MRDYFNELASRWDGLPGPPDAAERVEEFLNRAALAPGSRVLDAGAGTGILADGLRRRGCIVVEFDFAEQMLAEARRKSAGAIQSYVCGDLLQPPFQPGAFDAVLCFNTLPHARPIEAALSALMRCAGPSGRLAIGHMMSSQALNELHGSIGGAVGDDHLPPATRVGAILESSGARIFAADESSRHYFVLAGVRE